MDEKQPEIEKKPAEMPKKQKDNPKQLGQTSVVLAIISLIILPYAFAAAAIGLGLYGFTKAGDDGKAKGLCIAGVVIAIASLVLKAMISA
ncbi:MAG: hypothetical protein O3B64_01325 [bacterium]|nr:hypothetical protein [bacterium]